MITQPGYISQDDAERIDEFLRRARLGGAYDLIDGEASTLGQTDEPVATEELWPDVIGEASSALPGLVTELPEVGVATQEAVDDRETDNSNYVTELKLFYNQSPETPVPYSVDVPYLSHKLRYESDHVVAKLEIDDIYGPDCED